MRTNATKKVVAIIQARMSSTRLPGKVLLPLAGKSVIERMLERARLATSVDEIVVATTTNPADDMLVEVLQNIQGQQYFRGSEPDVLGRVIACAGIYGADVVVDLTADCPLVDPAQIDALVSWARMGRYAHNCCGAYRQWPDGMDVQAYPLELLRHAAQHPQSIREHSGWNIWNLLTADMHMSGPFIPGPIYKATAIALPGEREYAEMAMTLDTPEDYDVLSKVFEVMKSQDGNTQWTAREVIDFYLREKLYAINGHIQRRIPGIDSVSGAVA